MRTMTDAVRVLAYVPDCTDAAVRKLESLAPTRREADVLTQLAGAYYIRAQRKDQPSDFVRALDAADTAVRLAPASAPARFNLALIEEALGFSSDAIRSWDLLRRGTTGDWAKEAARHWERLTRESTRVPVTQWRLNEEQLPKAARAGDRKAVESLIAPYRQAAQEFVEYESLVAWARAREQHDDEAAAGHLAVAEVIAETLARLSREPYLRDVVAHIRRADATSEASLRRGISAFAEGRALELQLRYETAAAAFTRAERAFRQAGSPMRLMAMIKRGAPLALSSRYGEATQLYAEVETEAKRAGYASILARVYTGRAFVAFLQSRYVDSVVEYTDAESRFAQLGDRENVGNVLTRRVGLYRLIGDQHFTWREIVRARDHAETFLDSQSLHMYLGESARAALELGYPRVALRYQNAAMAMLQDALKRSGGDETLLTRLRTNISVAFRGRAAIHAHMEDDEAARRDLNQASAHVSDNPRLREEEEAIENGFLARLAEVQAQTLAMSDRKQAIAVLSRGIEYASRTHYRSMMAYLLVQRADLHRRENARTAELTDLREALRALHREEQAMLGGARSSTVAGQMWSAYFSRYQKTYRRLIQRLVDDGDDQGAFHYAERARGYEPLYRILQKDDVPPDFRARIRDGEPFRLEDVKQTLPENTFLVQYAVMDDRTYVWTIWNGDFHRTTLPVGNAEIERWTSTLQRLGQSGNVEGFKAALSPPYSLLREPLARIAKVNGRDRTPTVVIVPDRAMHGLPFSALRDGETYVVQHHLVSVAPSATLYAFSRAKDRQRATLAAGSMLLVADPAFDQRLGVARGLSRLQWARTEATHLDALYGKAITVEPLMDGRATAAEFLRRTLDSSIIHIAAHGVANPDIPSRSYLLFAPAGRDDSGVVDAEALLASLRLKKARLAVLAACSSAGGTAVGPEGLAPLVRPLLIAGAPGVVGALWNVNENSATAELLVRFHRHYRNGRDADDALRLAQMEMLGDPELARSSAFAWAPFQAIGYASSPFRPHTRR